MTDTGKTIVFSNEPEKAGVNNLLEIYELLSGKPREAIERHFDGKGYGQLKQEVAEQIIESLRPIREKYHDLASDITEVIRILDDGAQRARSIAEPKIEILRNMMGLGLGQF